MKIVYFFSAILLVTMILASCRNQMQSNVQNEFPINDLDLDFTRGFAQAKSFNLDYAGDITNQTENFYKRAMLSIRLEVTLENGKVLTDYDMGRIMEDIEFIDPFEPHQTYHIKDLQVYGLDNLYLKYPVKLVVANFKLVLIDDINNTRQEEIIKKLDITDQWMNAASGNIGKEFSERAQERADSINAAMEKSNRNY